VTSADQRYALLFDRNLAGVYCTTLDGRILDCNESLATMLGYGSREELLSQHASALYFEPADREDFLARLRRTGLLSNSELRLRRKDGRAVFILENVNLVADAAGRPAIILGTAVDITERKRAELALFQSEVRYRSLAEDLRRLTHHLHTVREEERARIARELHDELGQSLTALSLDLHWMGRRAGLDDEETQSRLHSMVELVGRTIQSVRRICAELRPAVLDDLGLAAAMEWQADEFQKRTGLRCRLTLPRYRLGLPSEHATCLFRIFQESLTNVARHARATEVRARLRVAGRRLVLCVCDNGVGMTREQAGGPGSLGLAGIRERALQCGGRVRVSGTPGQGTTVLMRMPIQVPAEAGGE